MKACILITVLFCTSLGIAPAFSVEAPEVLDDERRQFMERALLGQIDYLAAQGKYYEALQLISDNDLLGERTIREKLKQRKLEHGNGRKTLAEIEIAYRMNQRAGNAVREVLDADVELKKRNQAAYDLARIYYRKSRYDYARFALQLLRGDLYYPLEHDVAYLTAMIDARTGKVEQAIDALDELKGDKRTLGFARFNLAHLQLQHGHIEQGVSNLIEVGQIQSEDVTVRALADKANLVLGYRYLSEDDAQNTIKYLSRVKLDGAFTSKALLGLAWTYMKNEDYRSAIVPWAHLSESAPIDTTVLEATIALPYVYGKLGVHGKAASLYQQAVDTLSEYQVWLQTAMNDVEESGVIGSLQQSDMTGDNKASGLLVDLLASKQYQESVKNYRDLSHMVALLQQRVRSMAITREMLEARYVSFDADTLRLDTRIERINSQLNDAEKRRQGLDDEIEKLAQQLNATRISKEPVPRMLAAAESTVVDAGAESVVSELSLLDDRLQAIRQHRDDLESLLGNATQRRDALLQQRESLTSYEEFMVPVTELSERTRHLLDEMNTTLDQQREMLKKITTEALQHRLALVTEYATTARYELAKSYDIIADKERAEPGKVLELRTGGVISP